MNAESSQSFRRWISDWEGQAKGGRIASAKGLFDQLLDLDLPPAERALTIYDSAVFNWDYLGNGTEARDLFNRTLEHFAEYPEARTDARVANLTAYAFENQMLLSLSFDEYDKWADELRRIRPDEGILQGQLPTAHQQRDEGQPWSAVMRMIASSYYRRNDPASDPGLYGRGAGVYQLLLENRRTLRLNREEWSEVLYEYGALMHKMTMVATRAMEQQGRVYSGECRFYAELARSRIDEFVLANPPNDGIKSLSRNTDELLAISSDNDRAPADLTADSASPARVVGGRQLAGSCLLRLILAVIIALLIYKVMGRI